MNKIITEITPLSDKDFFYLVDRTKDEFNFPVHRHSEFELNYVENCKGATRIVGDSIEELGDFDLVLLGHGIEHAWQQANCESDHLREITIQFSSEFNNSDLLKKNQLASIRSMLERCDKGIVFGMKTIMKVHNQIENLFSIKEGFNQVMSFLTLLYELSLADDARTLSSSSFANIRPTSDSRRVLKVQEYIDAHFKEDLRLETLAGLVGMTPTSFSRFFKLRTGRSLSDYISDIRIGHASRLLMDSTTSIAEICYECGFNNISNFNRIFKKKKGRTPKEFRDYYQRNKTVV